jgi:alpha-mannosidase
MSAEIRRDAFRQSFMRLSNRLVELSAWNDRARLSLPPGEIRLAPNEPWKVVKEGAFWAAQDSPVEIRFTSIVPPNWAGLPVHCRFQLGGEALLFINDEPVGGLNALQTEHPVLANAQGQEKIRFRAEAVPHGLFGTPNSHPQIETACLLVPDTEVRALWHDLAASLDAARYLHSIGRDAIVGLLLDSLQSAFRAINLPRDNTEEYLARIAAVSISRAYETFYDNQESLASLWEDWRFRLPSGAFGPEQYEQLRVVRKNFNRELVLIREKYPSEGEVWLTGHAHIDLAWLWPLDETRRKARRTFHNVVSLIEKYPELHFNQSSAQLYSWIEQYDQPLFEKIRDRIAHGSWEIVGGMWVEPDGNIPAGESWVRQLLFGQKYFETRFGKRAQVAWLPDSFGFTGNLPQLLKSAGIPYFFTHKLSWNERNQFPYDLYWWEGIDGSRVLAHSFNNPETGYNARLTAEEIGDTWRNFQAKRQHECTLLSFGYGDGGGGPSSDMLERFARLKEFPGLPRLRMGSVAEFYERLPKENLPVWVGEQYLEYHRATYTTQSRVKFLHRKLEHALVESETAATLAFVLKGEPYPNEQLHRLWEVLLLNEFHDILPGSSIHTVYETAHVQLSASLEDSGRLLTAALAGTHGQTNSAPAESRKGLIWNLELFDRPLVLEIPVDTDKELQLVTTDGREIPNQRLDGNRILLEAEGVAVPALGAVSVAAFEHPQTAVHEPLLATTREMENLYLRIRFRENGSLASIYDKEAGREVLTGPGHQLWLYTDLPRQFDAWDIDSSYVEEGVELIPSGPAVLTENGPLRGSLRVAYQYDAIEIVQTYRLRRLSRILEIYNRVHWSGRRRMLRAIIPLDIRTHEMWAETAFGAVARFNNRNTPWDQARFEVPAHGWVDLSEPSYGVSVLNNGKYGHSANGNVLGISLLRSPIYPDPYADEGDHEFLYAIFPHRGTWRNGTVRAAKELHRPLRYRAGNSVFPGDSLLRLQGDPLELSCFKRMEDSDDVLVRLYEPHGDRGCCILQSARDIERAAIVNILEEQSEELKVEDRRRVKVLFTPFQVISLRLSLARRVASAMLAVDSQ